MASVRDGIYAGCFAGRPVKRLAQNALTALMLAGATPDGLEAAGYPEDVVEQLRGALVERLVKVRDMLCPCMNDQGALRWLAGIDFATQYPGTHVGRCRDCRRELLRGKGAPSALLRRPSRRRWLRSRR
jgi:hypothetical protein